MRIVMISAEYPPMAGGVGDYTRRLNTMLTHQGHEVAVITGNQGQAYRDAARIYPVRVPVWNGAGINSVRQTISKLQPEIVHIQYQTGAYQMKIAINTLPSALKRERQKGLRVVTTAHDLLPPYLFPKAGMLRDWYTKRIIRDADGAILTNAGDYHTVMNDSRGAWNPRAVFIPIGANVTPAPPANFDREIWRSQFDIKKGDMLLAYFGLLTHTKGLENLLAMMEHLPHTTRLVLIGGIGERVEDQAYANAIRQLIAQKNLQERVIMTGHTEASDVSAYLIAADAVLLPFTDGYSYRRGSLITALAHGVPVITTYAPADIHQDPLPELIDGKHALLVEPENTEQLVTAVLRLQQEPELCHRLARTGQALTEVFSWERIVAQHEALYAAIR